MKIYIIFKVFPWYKEFHVLFLSKTKAEDYVEADTSIHQLVVEEHWAN